MYTHPFDYIRCQMAAITPSFRDVSGMPFTDWQRKARTKLSELLGLPLTKGPNNPVIEYEKRHDSFTEVRFTLETEPGFHVPCHLLTPIGITGKLPVVICVQGHTKGMHISMGRTVYPGDEDCVDDDFAVRAVKEGFCAIAMEQRGFGELGGTAEGTQCTNPALTALLIGKTLLGMRVHDVTCVIDALPNFPQADADKLVLLGNSGGGTTTFFTSCLDERVCYAMPSCYFCTFDDSIGAMHHCACNFVPNIRHFFDMGDMAGMIAPRPMVVVAGRQDPIFPYDAVLKAYSLAQRKYQEAGAPDNVTMVTGEGGHRFYADQAWPVMKRYMGL